MSKVLKRLYLGDVVKSFGTKQLRKLTTEKPQEDSIIGTWVLNNDIVDVGINPKTYKLNYEISYVDYDTNELITGIVENGDFLWNRVVGENDYYLSIDNTASVNIYYWAGVNSGGSGKHPNVATVTRSGGYCKYIDKTSEVGIALRTIKIIGGTDIYNEDLIAIIKANATKQESIVGTWVFNDTVTTTKEDGSNVYFPYSCYGYLYVDSTWQYLEITAFMGRTYSSGDTGLSLNYRKGSSSYERSCYTSLSGWSTDFIKNKTIYITEEYTSSTFITWLKANATKIA